jgi:hypothetical protein
MLTDISNILEPGVSTSKKFKCEENSNCDSMKTSSSGGGNCTFKGCVFNNFLGVEAPGSRIFEISFNMSLDALFIFPNTFNGTVSSSVHDFLFWDTSLI